MRTIFRYFPSILSEVLMNEYEGDQANQHYISAASSAGLHGDITGRGFFHQRIPKNKSLCFCFCVLFFNYGMHQCCKPLVAFARESTNER